MAPKGKSAVNKKSGVKAKGKAKAAPSSSTSGNLSLKSRNDSEACTRLVRKHLKGWSPTHLCTKNSAGVSALEQVQQAVVQTRDVASRLNKSWWADFRLAFRDVESADQKLVVADAAQTLSPLLQEAWDMMNLENTHKKGLDKLDWFFTSLPPMLNQREVVVIFRIITDATLPSRRGGMTTIMKGLKKMHAAGHLEQFKDEFRCVKDEIDALLARYYTKYQNSIELKDFWSL